MSAVVISGDTSGSITLDAPAVAGSNTLTLPAATGTVIYSNASGNLQANSGYGSVATGYLCRAWVNFNGTGTVAIRASGNVTSITDNGTGDYTVNFTNAMPDSSYSTLCFSENVGVISSSYQSILTFLSSTASSVRINSIGDYPSAGVNDKPTVNVAIFR
jgi:hypothetical protein